MILRPCGECRLLVSPVDGCEHWRPVSVAARRPPSRPRAVTYDDEYSIYRFAEAVRQREVLRIAALADDGQVDPGRTREERDPARRLARAGLLEPVTRAGAYRITPKGREVWTRVSALLRA